MCDQIVKWHRCDILNKYGLRIADQKELFDKLQVILNEIDAFFHQLRQNMTTDFQILSKKIVLISKKEAAQFIQ